jgi:hypothetical protein
MGSCKPEAFSLLIPLEQLGELFIQRLWSYRDNTILSVCRHANSLGSPEPLQSTAAQQSPAVTEVCYSFCRKHGRHRTVKRREFITTDAGEIRRVDQRQDRESARHRGAAVAARPCRRGDRIAAFARAFRLLHLLTTGYGTKRT